MKKRRIFQIIGLVVLFILVTVLILGVIFTDNKNLEFEEINIGAESEKYIKIAHLSDLHFPKIKVNMDAMIATLQEKTVDIIAITGDIVDSSADILTCGVFEFVEKLSLVAPIFYVNGNHEKSHSQQTLLYSTLRKKGVAVLNNESSELQCRGVQFLIVGIGDNENYRADFLGESPMKDSYKVLLAHRPEVEKWSTYIAYDNGNQAWKNPDLVLTGHAHGGQIRMFGKGLVAPNQGLFPKYADGYYQISKKTGMVVSRGIGNSILPYRINNKPHIPIITVFLQ